MSPSPSGPGSWTLGSTLAGREKSRERTCPGLSAVAGCLPSASTALARPRGRRQLQRSEASYLLFRRPWERLGEISCRKSEIELSLPHEQSCTFAFQDRWFGLRDTTAGKIPRNPLISLDSDERIQGNPNESNTLNRGFQS
jgi:hypothetical protein